MVIQEKLPFVLGELALVAVDVRSDPFSEHVWKAVPCFQDKIYEEVWQRQ